MHKAKVALPMSGLLFFLDFSLPVVSVTFLDMSDGSGLLVFPVPPGYRFTVLSMSCLICTRAVAESLQLNDCLFDSFGLSSKIPDNETSTENRHARTKTEKHQQPGRAIKIKRGVNKLEILPKNHEVGYYIEAPKVFIPARVNTFALQKTTIACDYISIFDNLQLCLARKKGAFFAYFS